MLKQIKIDFDTTKVFIVEQICNRTIYQVGLCGGDCQEDKFIMEKVEEEYNCIQYSIVEKIIKSDKSIFWKHVVYLCNISTDETSLFNILT